MNFQKENIFTLDSKVDFLITVMSCLSQEESRFISENVRWGIRKQMADGKYSVSYGTEAVLAGESEAEEKMIRDIYYCDCNFSCTVV